jgi:hypothetical protein
MAVLASWFFEMDLELIQKTRKQIDPTTGFDSAIDHKPFSQI